MEGKRTVKYSRRAGSALLNILIAVVFGFIIDFAFMHNVMQSAYHYSDIQKSYNTHINVYKAKQDEYGIFYYDSSSSRRQNPDVTKEQIEAFSKDPVVIETAKALEYEDNQMTQCNVLTLAYDALIASFITIVFGDIMFGIGRSFGALLNKYKIEDEDGKKVKWYKMLLYGLTKWTFYIPLGAASIFMVPIIFNFNCIYSEDQRTYIDRWFHFELVIPEKYASDVE